MAGGNPGDMIGLKVNHQQLQANGKTIQTSKNHKNLMEILGNGKA
jgi:hypothetical protein